MENVDGRSEVIENDCQERGFCILNKMFSIWILIFYLTQFSFF